MMDQPFPSPRRKHGVTLFVVGGLLFTTALSCSEAKVVEDTASACSNYKDDDGDGLIDCDDPDCFSTAACERNAATCSNGIDDDGNGAIDCQQESCRSLSVCKDAVETACTVAAFDTGCPKGKGCYISEDNRRFCALEGPNLAGGICGNTNDPSDRSQGCAAGYLCIDRHRCARVCLRDSDCTRSSICLSRGGALSVCTLSCVDSRNCDADTEECVPLQRSMGLTLERGGWAHQCVPKPAPAAGSAAEGQPCFEDGRLNHPPSELCSADLLCVPEIGGNKCRKACRASSGGQPSGSSCPLGFLCYAIVPFSVQETRVDEPEVVGVCLP